MFPGSIKVYVARERIDLRKAYDGLGMLVQDALGMNPLSGLIFVFFNKKADKMKALYWDRNGFCIWQKRLEKGQFRIPTIVNSHWEVSFQELQFLLAGIDLRRLPPQVDYRNHVIN